MAICQDCKQDMSSFKTIGCTADTLFFPEPMERARYENEYDIDRCHDCNVLKGQYHHFGCDMERCPKCGEQLISCNCVKSLTPF